MRFHFLVPALLLAVACTPSTPSTGDSMSSTPASESASSSADAMAGEGVTIEWVTTEEAPGEFDQPNTSLSLKISGGVNETIALGTYAGSFSDGRNLQVELPSDALLSGALWFAGGGDEFIVQRDGDTLTVSHRVVDEQVTPGAFTVMKTVTLSTDAAVLVAPLVK